MSKIKEIRARQLIDCKCRPMVEVDIITDDGYIGSGSAPTGSSVGMYESYVLRDNNPKEYDGMSVHKAVSNVTEIIAPALIGKDIHNLKDIDYTMIELDGTPDKHFLGGNAIYSTSIAALRAAAECERMTPYRYLCGHDIKTVPVPSFNVINGGRYGDITLGYNEFLIVPYKADDIYEAVEIACKVFARLSTTIENHTGKAAAVARSYGYAAPTEDPEIALNLIQEAIDECGYHDKVCFALDCASSEMYDKNSNTYYLNGQHLTGEEMVAYAKDLSQKFNFLFIEDLLDENDWTNFSKAVSDIKKTIIIGDDLIATTPARLKRAYEEKAAEGFILKPNQIGTLTEAFEAHNYAKERGMFSIPSGRSGGVVGDIVMDLAVGFEIPFIKNGAPRSGERIDKLNFLMRACDTNPGCKMADLSQIIRF